MQRFEQYTATTAFVTPLYLIAIVLGTFGNALVIYFYITDIGIQRTFNYLLTNLAVADFVICAVFTPLLFAYRVHEKAEVIGFTPLCEISLFSSMFSVSLVYLVFPLMAYQRKDVMSRSLRATLSLTRRRVLMGTFWLSSFLSGAMMIILARSEFIDSGPSYVNMYRCIMINQRLDFYSQVFLGYSMALYGLSIVITAVFYVQIYLSPPINKSREERQITKLCAWLAILYTACWTPFVLVQISGVFGTYTELHFNLHAISSAVGVIGSAVAPCLYAINIPYYRARAHYTFYGTIYNRQKKK